MGRVVAWRYWAETTWPSVFRQIVRLESNRKVNMRLTFIVLTVLLAIMGLRTTSVLGQSEERMSISP